MTSPKVQVEVLEDKVDFGGTITVVWKHSDVRASNKDWIALYREGADVKEYFTFQWVNPQKNQITFVAPTSAADEYYFSYLANKTYEELGKSRNFRIGPSFDMAILSSERDSSTHSYIVKLLVTQQFGKVLSTMWVALYNKDAPLKKFHSYQYCHVDKELTFKVPGPGEWRFRLFPQKLYIPILTLNHTIEDHKRTVIEEGPDAPMTPTTPSRAPSSSLSLTPSKSRQLVFKINDDYQGGDETGALRHETQEREESETAKRHVPHTNDEEKQERADENRTVEQNVFGQQANFFDVLAAIKKDNEAKHAEVKRKTQEEREMRRLTREREAALREAEDEDERIDRERAESERLELERLESERLRKEEQERLENEERQKQIEKEQREELERLRKIEQEEEDRIQREAERIRKLQEEKDLEDRLEREREEERDRLERERVERERLEAERIERERIRKEKERLEKIEKERLERQKKEIERLEQELEEKERREMLEKQEEERIRLENERIEKENEEREKEQQRLDEERRKMLEEEKLKLAQKVEREEREREQEQQRLNEERRKMLEEEKLRILQEKQREDRERQEQERLQEEQRIAEEKQKKESEAEARTEVDVPNVATEDSVPVLPVEKVDEENIVGAENVSEVLPMEALALPDAYELDTKSVLEESNDSHDVPAPQLEVNTARVLRSDQPLTASESESTNLATCTVPVENASPSTTRPFPSAPVVSSSGSFAAALPLSNSHELNRLLTEAFQVEFDSIMSAEPEKCRRFRERMHEVEEERVYRSRTAAYLQTRKEAVKQVSESLLRMNSRFEKASYNLVTFCQVAEAQTENNMFGDFFGDTKDPSIDYKAMESATNCQLCRAVFIPDTFFKKGSPKVQCRICNRIICEPCSTLFSLDSKFYLALSILKNIPEGIWTCSSCASGIAEMKFYEYTKDELKEGQRHYLVGASHNFRIYEKSLQERIHYLQNYYKLVLLGDVELNEKKFDEAEIACKDLIANIDRLVTEISDFINARKRHHLNVLISETIIDSLKKGKTYCLELSRIIRLQSDIRVAS